MKKFGLTLLTGYLFVLLLIAFIPVKNLYFLAQTHLQKRNLFINQQEISRFFVQHSINKGEVFFEDIKALSFDELSINPWLLYNQVAIYDIRILEALKAFLPVKIEFVKLSYTLFYPIQIGITSKGDYGEAEGEIDLLKRTVTIRLSTSYKMRKSYPKLLSMMKKLDDKTLKNGYIYEYRF